MILRQGEAEVGLVGQKAGIDNRAGQPEAEPFLDAPVAIGLPAVAAEPPACVVSHACLVKLRFELQVGIDSIQREVALPMLGTRRFLREGRAPAEQHCERQCNNPDGDWN